MKILVVDDEALLVRASVLIYRMKATKSLPAATVWRLYGLCRRNPLTWLCWT